ncbi:MAG: citrate/2-methylcitrate synthase [Tindallia sp. MSAO_Bac2]|nr:MAG: citrate/2-methylcitrate synthase [Tindallia sp. MSAO_Bac2]
MQYFLQNEFFQDLAQKAENRNAIDPACYDQYQVMRGLRHKNGTGVLVGLTEIADVQGYTMEKDKKIPAEGTLYYRGMDMAEIMRNCQAEKRRGFEETTYLLLLGELPDKAQLSQFDKMLDDNRFLPRDFTENMILQAPSRNVMNNLQRCILVLYSYDENPDDISVTNLLRQSIQLIAQFPTIISYGYQAKAHYFENKSLYIHSPKPEIGTAENVLHMIRKDNSYTRTEAETLDLCMVIHAEHGGGNNSTFANRVVSSSGTDTYSAIATAVGSMKGSKHGGANLKVKSMVEDIKNNCYDWTNKVALRDYLVKILRKEAFDGEGLIYGMGHAIYTLSDPRAVLLREKARELAREKGAEEAFSLYQNIEELTKEIFKEFKGPDFATCANVDLYSGFVYQLLGIPDDLYTPLFAAARISGWCANRIEQIVSDNRIIRPAYKSVSPKSDYIPMDSR